MIATERLVSIIKMSSFIAHSLIGFAVGAQKQQATLKQTLIVSACFIVLASTPDIDYIFNWLTGYSMSVRYTHSTGYVFFVGLFFVLLRKLFFRRLLANVPAALFFLAPATHLILDGLVAIHGNPYLYPFTDSVFTLPIGILPSSGQISFYNVYFWRNIFIELLIFIPIVIALTPPLRQLVFKYKTLTILLGLVFITGLIIGFNLER